MLTQKLTLQAYKCVQLLQRKKHTVFWANMIVIIVVVSVRLILKHVEMYQYKMQDSNKCVHSCKFWDNCITSLWKWAISGASDYSGVSCDWDHALVLTTAAAALSTRLPEDASLIGKVGWHSAAQPFITIDSLNFHHRLYHTLTTAPSCRIVDWEFTARSNHSPANSDRYFNLISRNNIDNKGEERLCDNASSNPQMRRYHPFITAAEPPSTSSPRISRSGRRRSGSSSISVWQHFKNRITLSVLVASPLCPFTFLFQLRVYS